jgi:anaerobic carbon-monoxide dehydrogenase, CODH/ACS complex subunit alpha
VLHAGLMDHVAMEVGDIAQIVARDMPKGSDDAHFVELGFGTIDTEKPVILRIGHNVASGAGIRDYLEDEWLEEDVEVCGICCAAIDITQYNRSAKFVGPLSKQLKFIRSNGANMKTLMVVDPQMCTECMDRDKIIPACVKACKDNVLKFFSLEDLEALKKDVSYLEVLEKTMRTFKKE